MDSLCGGGGRRAGGGLASSAHHHREDGSTSVPWTYVLGAESRVQVMVVVMGVRLPRKLRAERTAARPLGLRLGRWVYG